MSHPMRCLSLNPKTGCRIRPGIDRRNAEAKEPMQMPKYSMNGVLAVILLSCLLSCLGGKVYDPDDQHQGKSLINVNAVAEVSGSGLSEGILQNLLVGLLWHNDTGDGDFGTTVNTTLKATMPMEIRFDLVSPPTEIQSRNIYEIPADLADTLTPRKQVGELGIANIMIVSDINKNGKIDDNVFLDSSTGSLSDRVIGVSPTHMIIYVSNDAVLQSIERKNVRDLSDGHPHSRWLNLKVGYNLVKVVPAPDPQNDGFDGFERVEPGEKVKIILSDDPESLRGPNWT